MGVITTMSSVGILDDAFNGSSPFLVVFSGSHNFVQISLVRAVSFPDVICPAHLDKSPLRLFPLTIGLPCSHHGFD